MLKMCHNLALDLYKAVNVCLHIQTSSHNKVIS